MPGKKLLVADDSLTIQKVIRLALSNEGYEIQAVSDGNDAIQQISLFRPDVILVDVALPGQSAFELKRAVNQLEDLAQVRFVLMSSAFEKVDENQAAEVTFHGRLTKPFDPAHLRRVLTEALATQKSSAENHFFAPPPIPTQTPTPITPNLTPVPTLPPLPMSPLGTPEFATPPPFANPLSSAPPARPSNPESVHPSITLSPPPVSTHEFESPVQSQQPLVESPPVEKINDLWDHSPQLDTAAVVVEDSASSSDDDIKHLTESTIRMSGLNEFDWSVNEPTLKPTSAMQDVGGSNFPKFDVEPPAAHYNATPAAHYNATPAAHYNATPAPVSPQSASPSAAYFNAPEETVSSAQLEALVKSQVEEIAARLVRQILPDVAEKLVKAEIHRLLSEQP